MVTQNDTSTELERLREFYNAYVALQEGIASFDLHNEAVDRLERALASLEGEKW